MLRIYNILTLASILVVISVIDSFSQSPQMTITAPFTSACSGSVFKIRMTSSSGVSMPIDYIQKREFVNGVWGAWTNFSANSTGYDGAWYWMVTLSAKTEYRLREAISGGTLYSNVVSVDNQYLPRLLLYGQDPGGAASNFVANQGASIDFDINKAGATNVTVTWYKNNVQQTINPYNQSACSTCSHQYNYSGSLSSTWKAYVNNNQTPGSCGGYTNEITIKPSPHIAVSGSTTVSLGESVNIDLLSYYHPNLVLPINYCEKREYVNGSWSNWQVTSIMMQYNYMGKGYWSTGPLLKRTQFRVGEPVSGGVLYSNIVEFGLLNSITEYTPITVISTETIGSAPVDKVNKTVTYFDGLGRPIQLINWQSSPLTKDVVQPIAYDGFGRQPRKYLPVVLNANSGFYKDALVDANGNYTSDALNFYNNTTDKIADDSKPFSESVFEPSPLSRVIEQGSPGLAWQPDLTDTYVIPVDRSIKMSYEFNSPNEVLLWSYTYPTLNFPFGLVNAGSASSPVYFETNQLFKNKTKDEHRNEVIEFIDKQGRIVLKKVQTNATQYASTYYIYDDFGSLVCVVPPEAVARLSAEYYHSDATDASKNEFLNRWFFCYRYDGKKRLIQKKVPGVEPIWMLYDKRDRLVMTQDGNQRLQNQWLFTKYDVLNRPIINGIYNHGFSASRDEMDTLISSNVFYEIYNGAVASHGYSNTTAYFPSLNTTVLAVTYYDNYNFKSMASGLNYVNNDLTGQPTTENLRLIGQVTGTKVNILGTTNYLYSISYFDDKNHIVQTISENHKSGVDRVTNKFNFLGKVLETKQTYSVSAVTKTVKESFTYDHAGRLLTVMHSTNGAADVLMVKNVYNELGQLVDKQLHSTDNGVTFKQSVDYLYNIRGWIAKINESDISTLASGETLGDYFGMELGYNTPISGITSSVAFNGNISATKWSTGTVGGSNLQGNTYDYDPLNRLTNSSHYKDALAGWTSDNSNLENGFSYDLNGNILALTRKGDLAATVDSLSFNYIGNQLNYVNDAGDASKGFMNGNTGNDDYAYDGNGNLIKDKNKSVANDNDIKYNYLNLPIEVIKGANKVKYWYDATGRKLYQELHTGASVTKTTDYVGELVFENNILQFINTSEGRVLPDGANWEYQYHLKDHLGNIRVTFTSKTPAVISHPATFETGTQTTEQTLFGSSYSSIAYDLVDYTDAGTTYQKVQLLNGGINGRVGLAKSYSVMPGDKIKAEVFAKYRNLGSSPNTTAFITALASAFGTSSVATGELGKIYNGLNSFAAEVPGGDHPYDLETAPKAFVTIILFDKNYNIVDANWDQIDVSANQTSGTVKTPPIHDYMVKEITVTEPGYAYVFLSNEHPTFVDVYFDNFTITYTPSPIVGVNDYYAFGLAFNSHQRENSSLNNYLYNGKEKQDELDLGWLDFGARQYDATIGRWLSHDPLSEKFYGISGYVAMANNPICFVDPDGMQFTDAAMAWLNRLVRELNELQQANAGLMARLQDKINAGGLSDRKLGRLNGRIERLQSTNTELEVMRGEIFTMGASSQVYNVVETSSLNGNGGLPGLGDAEGEVAFNSETGAVDIKISSNASIGLFAHELKHGYQFETGKYSIGPELSGAHKNFLYDKHDEVAGYDRGAIFGGTRYSIKTLPAKYDGVTTGPVEATTHPTVNGIVNHPILTREQKGTALQRVASGTGHAFRFNGTTYYKPR
jgi:RHS repeat-associated protein